MLADHLLAPVLLELGELLFLPLPVDVVVNLGVSILGVHLSLGDDIFGGLTSIGLLLGAQLLGLFNFLLALDDALPARVNLLVDGKEEGVLALVGVEVGRPQLVLEALAGRVVLLDDFDKLVGMEFFLVQDVTLLEEVDDFCHIEGDVFSEAEQRSRGFFRLLDASLGEVLEDSAELILELREYCLGQLEVFVIISRLCLVLGGKRSKFMLEEVLDLV